MMTEFLGRTIHFKTLQPLTHLKLILFVFGALVKRPVIAKPPNMVDFVEALDVVGHSVSLQDVLVFRDRTNSINLQI